MTTLNEYQPIFEKFLRKEKLSREEAVAVWARVNQIFGLDPAGQMLLMLFGALERELGKGERCSVCGRYQDSQCWKEC